MFNFNFYKAQTIILIVLFLLIQPSFSQEEEPGIRKWHNGWAFFNSVGFTLSRYINAENDKRGPIGPNLNTSVGYCYNQVSCIEFGALVSANYYNDLKGTRNGKTLSADVTMWETAFFLALRSQLTFLPISDSFNPWYKVFMGAGNSIGFIDEVNGEDVLVNRSDRFQSEGPLFGNSFTFFFNAFNDKPMWFIEITGIMQLHFEDFLIENSEELPIVLNQSANENNSHSIRGSFNIGMRLF